MNVNFFFFLETFKTNLTIDNVSQTMRGGGEVYDSVRNTDDAEGKFKKMGRILIICLQHLCTTSGRTYGALF